MKIKKLFPLLLILSHVLVFHQAFCQKPVYEGKPFYNNLYFTENKGQIVNENGEYQPGIKYYARLGEMNIYFSAGQLSFVRIQQHENPKKTMENEASFILEATRAEMHLLNCNAAATIAAEEPLTFYQNFYLGAAAKNNTASIHAFKKIIYRNVYQHIDMVITAHENGLKYEFHVNPGGHVNDIQIQWTGIHSLHLQDDGSISCNTHAGDITDSKPYSYQGTQSIKSEYVISGAAVGFKTGNYNTNQLLVIDPEMKWGSYFGSTSADNLTGMVTDSNNNTYITGYTTSTTGIATSGAYQTSLVKDVDGYIAKLGSNGTLQWATYYGGENTDMLKSIASDHNGNLYVAGITYSRTGIATSGAYQTSYGSNSTGDGDAWVAMFSVNGYLQWGTYYGGKAYDAASSVATDGAGNVIVTGTTLSSSGIASSGAYQTLFNNNAFSTDYDPFIVKFNSSGKRQWGTYFGDYYDDFSYSIAADNAGNVYITGSSMGPKNTLATSGAYQTFAEGVFLSKFNSSGSLSWSTYFGTELKSNAIAVDETGNVYIGGITNGNTLVLPTTSGSYQSSSLGYYANGWLAKFSNSGSFTWATYYGGNDSDQVTAITPDHYGYINITGSARSKNNIATSGAYQTAPDLSSSGASSAFLARFSGTGKIVYATYYGGPGPDYGTAISADAYGRIYIGGNTFAASGIATSGSYKTTYSGAQDAFIAAFNFNGYTDAGALNITNPKQAFCAGIQTVKTLVHNFGKVPLTAMKVGWSINGTSQTPVSWSGKLLPDSSVEITLGTYNFSIASHDIKAWTYNPNSTADSTNYNDSITMHGTATGPLAVVGAAQTICQGDKVTMGANPTAGHTYSWTSVPAGYSNLNALVTDTPAVTTVYYLTEIIKATGCAKSDSVVITVNQRPIADAGKDTTVCSGSRAVFGTGKSVSGISYYWSSNPSGFSASGSLSSDAPAVTTVYHVNARNNTTGCTNNDSVTVTVNPTPVPGIVASQALCSGSTLSIGKAVTGGHRYSWTSKPSGFTSLYSNPAVSPTVNTTYYLKESDLSTGCAANDSVTITINPLPAAAVGNSQSICAGQSVTLGNTSVTGNSYSWTSKPTGFTSSSSKPVFIPSVSSVYYLTETIKATGCHKTDSVTVIVNPLPAAKTVPGQKVCENYVIQLGAAATASSKYQWTSRPAGYTAAQSNPKAKISANTTYILTETDTATGCSKTDSVSITVIAGPKAVTGSAQAICSGDSTAIGGSAVAGNTYAWSSIPAGFTSSISKPVIKPAATAWYYLTEKILTSGCTKTDSVKITVNPLPSAAWLIKYAGNTATLHAADSTFTDAGYHWDFGDGDTATGHTVSHLYPKNKTYTIRLRLTDDKGCRNESDSLVKIILSGIDDAEDNARSIIIYPNPYQETAVLQYTLSQVCEVDIAVFDLSGRRIQNIAAGSQEPGKHQFSITGADGMMTKGLYLLKLNISGNVYTKLLERQ